MTMERGFEEELDFGEARGLDGGAAAETPRAAPPGPISPGHDVLELWYRLLARPWSCLVVVSPDETPATLRLARDLAELGTYYRRHPVEVIDGTRLDVERAAAIAHRLEPQDGAPRRAEPRFVVALDSPIANPIAFGVLAAGDTVLMLLEKGVTRIPDARRIAEVVGRERLVGAVLAVKP